MPIDQAVETLKEDQNSVLSQFGKMLYQFQQKNRELAIAVATLKSEIMISESQNEDKTLQDSQYIKFIENNAPKSQDELIHFYLRKTFFVLIIALVFGVALAIV